MYEHLNSSSVCTYVALQIDTLVGVSHRMDVHWDEVLRMYGEDWEQGGDGEENEAGASHFSK